MTVDCRRMCAIIPAIVAIVGCADDVGRAERRGELIQTKAPAAMVAAKPAAPQLTWVASFPFFFEPNLGQADRRVRFLSRGPGYNLFLTDNEAVIAVPVSTARDRAAGLRQAQVGARKDRAESAVLRIGFAGAARHPRMSADDRLSGVVNHQVGGNPAAWRSKIPTYRRARYHDLYPGIDVVFRGGRGGPAYDFVVAPGAKPTDIRLRFRNADRLTIDKNGDLVMRVAGRDFRQSAPQIYQEIAGKRSRVSGGYVLRRGNEIGFRIGSYDRSRPLIIDPTLDFAALVGGTDYENVTSLAVDTSGNAYVAAYSRSIDLPPIAG